MAESSAGPGPGADTGPSEGPAPDWGRLLDAAALGAAAILVMIVADIWTDGRLISRRLHRGEGPAGDPAAD